MDRTEQFIRELTASQTRLYAYILVLLPDPEAAGDVLQETNLVLWRKAAEFTETTNFIAWSCRIAHFQVLAWLRDRGRERRRFDDRLMSQLAAVAESEVPDADARVTALRECLKRLGPKQHDLIERRYGRGDAVQSIARDLDKSENAISRMLYRVRLMLLECVRRRMAAEA